MFSAASGGPFVLLAGRHGHAIILLRLTAGQCGSVNNPRSWRETREAHVTNFLQRLWNDERGQDIAEYAVMLAVILVIVVGTIRLIGSNANNVFSQVGSAIQ